MSSGPILVIKLGALGDFIQALGPMAAIRAHHPSQSVTLLTSSPFETLALASGLFDKIEIDPRPKALEVGKWLSLRQILKGGQFQRVYDLQTSDRSSWYYRLFFPGARPEWSGIASGCSHPHDNSNRDFMHTIDRQREQLELVGLGDIPDTDLSWAKADLSKFDLAEPFALLFPGGAPHRPAKRWPGSHFNDLARRLSDLGITPVVLGVVSEKSLAKDTLAGIAGGRDLTGQTDLIEIATLAGKAVLAIGNDTGPMHVAASAGCPGIVLFSDASDPKLCAPRGEKVVVIERAPLDALSVDEVLEAASIVASI